MCVCKAVQETVAPNLPTADSSKDRAQTEDHEWTNPNDPGRTVFEVTPTAPQDLWLRRCSQADIRELNTAAQLSVHSAGSLWNAVTHRVGLSSPTAGAPLGDRGSVSTVITLLSVFLFQTGFQAA